MSVLDKFKDLIGIEEIEEEDVVEAEPEAAPADRRRSEVRTAPVAHGAPKEKVVPMNNKSSNPFKLMVIEPAGFEECPKLVDSLRARKPVIINLEKIDSENARKIFDFLSGATYALNGNVQKVANNIFIFAPENVDITSSTADTKAHDYSNKSDSWR